MNQKKMKLLDKQSIIYSHITAIIINLIRKNIIMIR